jgi:hypothetical protein
MPERSKQRPPRHPRNPIAKEVRSPKYRQRIVPDKRKYDRKHKSQEP